MGSLYRSWTMLRVPMLARLATQLGGRAFPQSRAVVRPTFRALCSAPVDLTMKKEESVFSLESIAEQADYPRVAKEMLKSFPDDFVEEMTKELGSQENPVAGMNELVEMWMDPEASAEELEASTDQLMTDIHADDAQDPEELQAQIDAHVNKVFDQMGIDLGEGIEASDLGEFEEDPTPEASGPDVDDWRRLQDMTKTNRHEASDSDEALSQKHPWFKTRRLELGVKLPTAQLAGSDPLANVFGVSVAAPTFTGQLPKGQREPYFYPGNILEPETLNPPRFDDGKTKVSSIQHEQEDCEEEDLPVQNRPRANARCQKCGRTVTICERGWQDSTTEANRHLCQEPTQICQDSQAIPAVWPDSNHLPHATPSADKRQLRSAFSTKAMYF